MSGGFGADRALNLQSRRTDRGKPFPDLFLDWQRAPAKRLFVRLHTAAGCRRGIL
jgi:hypothetical protein